MQIIALYYQEHIFLSRREYVNVLTNKILLRNNKMQHNIIYHIYMRKQIVVNLTMIA